jgi:hypothetical protein
MTNVSGSLVCPIFRVLGKKDPKTLKMGQTSDPETLVVHQKLMPGNNPKNFKQYYDHGGSLQLHMYKDITQLLLLLLLPLLITTTTTTTNTTTTILHLVIKRWKLYALPCLFVTKECFIYQYTSDVI